MAVPAWKEDTHWDMLVNSTYAKGYFIIKADDHSYCQGSQYVRTHEDKYRPAPFDTAFFFMQNQEGSLKWPLNDESEGKLRNAFKSARYLCTCTYKCMYEICIYVIMCVCVLICIFHLYLFLI